jgi:hypothetical protein
VDLPGRHVDHGIATPPASSAILFPSSVVIAPWMSISPLPSARK